VLSQETSHDDLAILFGAGVLSIAAVELLGRPRGNGALVSLNGRELLGVPGHVVHQRIGQGRRERLAALEAFRRETKSSSLHARVTGRRLRG
jgi:hypothetical protein